MELLLGRARPPRLARRWQSSLRLRAPRDLCQEPHASVDTMNLTETADRDETILDRRDAAAAVDVQAAGSGVRAQELQPAPGPGICRRSGIEHSRDPAPRSLGLCVIFAE